MAYKVSFGSYQHSGSLQATVDITGSTTVSGAVGNFGTLTVGTFSPANISSTNITASSNMSASTANFGTLTVETFSPANISTTTLTVTGVTTLSGNVALGDAPADVITVNGQITGSLFEINGGTINATTIGASTQSSGKFTTLSASSTLDVGGTTTVQALSSSVGVSASVGQFGTLTAASFNPATISTTDLTVTGVTTLSGNVFLGDAAADIVTVNGQITGSLFAINGGAINDTSIGGTTQRGGRFTTLSASSTLDVVGTSTLQTLNAQATTATTLSASSTLQAGGDLTVAGASVFNGNVSLGNAGADIISVGGLFTSSLAPRVSGEVSIGSPSNLWLGISGQEISASLRVRAGTSMTAGTSITAGTFVTAQTLTASVGSTLGATLVTSLSSSGNVIVGGDLTVQGTTTTVNSTVVEIKDSNIIISSGSTTSLLANGSGLTLGSTGYQFNFQSSSAGTSTDFWQVSGSTGLTDFKAKTVFATVDGNVTQQTTNLGDADGTLSLGINYSQADFTGPHTWTLPASPSVGQSVKVKAPHNCNITNTLTVSAGAKAIDFTGNTTVVLASPDAALELVYVDSANNLWKIF
jgi:hypothetical protein